MAAAFPKLSGGITEVVQDNLLRAANDDGPISIRNGVKVSGSTALALRERHIFDPPILTALIPLLIDPSRCSFERTSNLGEENRGRFDS